MPAVRPGTKRVRHLRVPAIAVLGDQYATWPLTTPNDWLAGGCQFWSVDDADQLDAILRSGHAPRPLLLVYGKGASIVRAAAPILGLRRDRREHGWTFLLDDADPQLVGVSVRVGGPPWHEVIRQEGVTYFTPQGPGVQLFRQAMGY